MPKPAPLAGRGGGWFAAAVALHLGVEADFRPARKAHPAFRLARPEALAALAFRLAAAGHPVAWDEALAGVRRFYAHDPFGNRLEFLAAEHGEAREGALR